MLQYIQENERGLSIMRATGIVRRVDDLGKIVIPKELRNQMGIKEGTPMEMFRSTDGLVLRKYSTTYEIGEAIKTITEWVSDKDSDAHTYMTAVEMDILTKLLTLANRRDGKEEE